METISDTYVILEKLGEGSGGIVYKVYHKRLEKEVVIKRLRKKSVNMEINRQEVDILTNLHHTYLPQGLDFLSADGEIYTVMSYIPGKSFKQLMEEKYPFTQNELIRWGMQLCSALNYLHNQNPPIIHGDIKPANIMLTPDGNICLIDFNISFYLDGTTILGYTDGYTSPEQYIIALDQESASSLSNYTSINEKSDIYSVGATFYHLVTGKKAGNYRERPDASALEGRVSESFAGIILKAMQIDPDDRFQSAFEMFQALQGVTRKDQRYQALLKRQMAIRMGLVGLMAGFIVLGGYGIHNIKLEKVETYNSLVDKQTEYRENCDYEKEEKIYQEAVKVMPSALESYYQNACSLYEQQKYEECLEFIDYDILENEKLDMRDERGADIYHLKAECCMQLEKYEDAVSAFDQVFQYGGYNCEYYRDYAIALAYDADTSKAQEVLDEAIDHGLGEDSIYYTKGEIEKSTRQLDLAAEEFRKCIEISDNDELKARAYVMLSKIYEEQNLRSKERDILNEARKNVSIDHQMLILERLIQADIDLAENASDRQYRDEAIAVLQEVIEQGWDSYDTYNNLVILNEKQGYLDNARSALAEMEKLFGEDYNIYKRYAFLEIDIQALKNNSQRDYRTFEKYYQKAVSMYQGQMKDNNTDAEMGLLDNVYQQVKAGGWL